MKRLRKLWVAVGLFCVLSFAFLGFWLWAQFGFERTIVIYETSQPPVARSTIPKEPPAEETSIKEVGPVPVPEPPPWVLSVRWGTMGNPSPTPEAVFSDNPKSTKT